MEIFTISKIYYAKIIGKIEFYQIKKLISQKTWVFKAFLQIWMIKAKKTSIKYMSHKKGLSFKGKGIAPIAPLVSYLTVSMGVFTKTH
tara:strand:- start:317 stop:580 length:264 start_codon:yes stop_codon:yes gene_type:complete